MDNVKNHSTNAPEAVPEEPKQAMTTLRFSTIWDLPMLASRQTQADTATVTERFLTIWDSPRARLSNPTRRKRAPRKLPKFYL